MSRWITPARVLLIAGLLVMFMPAIDAAEYLPAPSAIELGIMQGRPVPSDNRVTLANWMSPPFNRWSLQNIPLILPTATVYRGDGPAVKLPSQKHDLGAVRFESKSGDTLSISQWLAASYTDGFIVMQNDGVVFEAYLNNMQPHTRHLSYSVSKSVIGILAGIMVEQGDLNLSRKVEDYVPELEHSGFGGYTVRELLDMQVAIEWNEDYSDPGSPWRRWKYSIGWTPLTVNSDELPEGNYNFLPTLQRDMDWSGGFKYVSPTAEVVGWILERAGGRPLADLLSRRLWMPLGGEHDAYITVDREFAPSAAGGFGATLRDLARFGQMVLNEGQFNGKTIVSEDWIADIRFNGDNSAWRNGQYRGFWNPKGAYRSFWYVSGDADGSFEALGIHGQRLYINPKEDLVVVRLSSYPEAVSRDDYDLSSRAIAAIVLSLQGRSHRSEAAEKIF
jgi:CubicO group peptidase (beta-lactamase class C family)